MMAEAETTNGAEEGVSPEEALEDAVTLHRSGKTEIAETLYRRILEVAPDYADALHFYGIMKHQQGKSLQAIALIRKAIEIEPDTPSMHINLGNVLCEVDRYDLARKAYEVAIVLDPDDIDARSNLGVTLRSLGEPEEAEKVYREAIAIDPTRREPWNNLGRLLASRGRVKEAIEAHAKALELEPHDADSRRFLIAAYAASDQDDRALTILRQWLKDDPTNPSALHIVAAISGENVPERASDSYVESMFDSFAASFDHKLAKLGYQAPGLVAAALAEAAGEPKKTLQVLDAGCGTGLCGDYLAPYAERLVGIDLSSGMLGKAAARGRYDALEHAELTQFLLDHPDAYDVVVSADTFCYFGALDEAMKAAAGALRTGGLLVFTVEEETGESDVKLNSHGRYTHTPRHVSAALAGAHLAEIKLQRAPLRMERGEPVAGFVVTARKG